MARIMITGASGLLGRAVVKHLAQHTEHQIIACGYSRAVAGGYQLDLTQADMVAEFVEQHKPDVIVHCAAERRPDISEQDPQAALALNAGATRSLALAASEHRAWLLYISTDYVFDGKAPQYTEVAQTNPVNFYGESKLQGEQIVLGIDSSFAVLRLPILYGDVEFLEESAVTVLLKHLSPATTVETNSLKRRAEHIDNWAIRSPTSTDDIASAITKMLGLHLMSQKALTGRYHFSAGQTMTKYQMLLQMAEILNVSHSHLIAVTSATDSAKRPKDCTLSCERLASLGIKSEVPFSLGMLNVLQHMPPALLDGLSRQALQEPKR
ncbi:dTDP-4-dehydrorhamnose reductase family protein [Shewanella pneumatophori]|uniref:dTDP-4-dehydrorhamnose reductase n=1 Tax=Shewanella pneumatophori TaxID=314092 RepID=A0A9X1ZL70_9GAMM|nr:SDR family oxidoreductase [Shewanella pneumatophori]MCL1139903.1 SDR family oxidoreductase [Shewanella pneumatophori]